MELLQVEFMPLEEDRFHFRVKVTNLTRGGEGSLSKAALPFVDFHQNPPKDWRFTLLKVLESDRFNTTEFDAAEQQWLIEQTLLKEDHSGFPSAFKRLSEIGSKLFRAIFPGGSEPEKILTIALNQARTEGTHLHIRFAFAGTIPQDVRIPDYPWELLYDGQKFLSQDVVTFSRYIEQTAPRTDLPPNQTINVLLVSSGAYDTRNGLDKLPKEEREAVIKGLRSAQAKQENGVKPAVRIHLLELKNPTRSELRKFLADNRGDASPHLLHFDGHGFFGRRCDRCRRGYEAGVRHCEDCGDQAPPLSELQGFLLFEHDDREADYVSANEFGELCRKAALADQPRQAQGVTVAVLSACKSGMSLGSKSVFNGMAQNLIASGVPAVLAMQYSVRVDAATAFTEHFYDALCHKNSLARAVSLGRSEMGADGNQWYRPVLYLRWQDNEGGQIFASSQSPLKFKVQRVLAMSLLVTGILFGLRFIGFWQGMELKALDHLMQMRLLNEGSDPRLVIVQITDQDITDQINRREPGMGSIKDMSLNRLLEKLQKFQPRLIGLDLYRDFDPNASASGLKARLQQPNVYTVCKVPETNTQGEKINDGIRPPRDMPLARIGFSDFVADTDKVVRRQILTQNEVEGTACRTAQSLSLLLTRRYLELTPGQNSQYVDPLVTDANLKLGKTSLESLQPFTGGYQDVQLGGYQVMLNYRATGSQPRDIAKLFTLDDILSDSLSLEDINDKIVLVGVTALTGINDNWETPYGTLPGVIVQAHMISQILSAVQNNRPLLKVLPQGVELLWIWGWGISGGLVVYSARTPRLLSIAGGTTLVSLYIICLCTLSWGNFWLPLIPSVFAYSFTSLGVFYATRKLSSSPTPIPTNHAQKIIP